MGTKWSSQIWIKKI